MSKEQIKQVFNHSAASALVVLGEPAQPGWWMRGFLLVNTCSDELRGLFQPKLFWDSTNISLWGLREGLGPSSPRPDGFKTQISHLTSPRL